MPQHLQCVLAGGVGVLVRAALLPGAGERLLGPAGAETGRDGEHAGRSGGAAGCAGCEYEAEEKTLTSNISKHHPLSELSYTHHSTDADHTDLLCLCECVKSC